MPLSTVFVSTISTRPRAWSSYTNIRAKNVHNNFTSMNSAEELSKYKDPGDSYNSPTLNRRYLNYGYDFPEKSPKKEKKWSLGSIFRRKNKKEETESSSDEETKKGFLNRKKHKSDKKKKAKPATFDHVVISRNSHLYANGHIDHGILSDPSGGFNNYTGRLIPRSEENLREPIKNSEESLETSNVSGSIDTLARKSVRKGFVSKVRAEARRTVLKQGRSSSDEDSQKSSKFQSDESLGLPQSRRSRSARTERYMKRHSRDGEAPNNYLKLSKSDVENWSCLKTSDESNRSLSRSPLVPKAYSSLSSQSQSISGLSTIPPSHNSHNRVRVSNSTSNPSYKPPQSMNEYNSTRKLPNDLNNRSVSLDANINQNKSPEPQIIHAQLQLGRNIDGRYRNLSLIDPRHIKQPPPPPPRDPRRLLAGNYYENSTATRPNTCYFDGQAKSKSFGANTKRISQNLGVRSTSEDYLPKNRLYLMEQQQQRPSSATPEPPKNYNYLTDKKPRSRKPIFIQNNKVDNNNGTQKMLQFWKQKEQGPQIFNCQTSVQTQVFLPSVLQNDITSEKLTDLEVTKTEDCPNEEYKEKSSNLEEALNELEAIYNSLRLGDEDLLERAEQREKEMEEERAKKYRPEKYSAMVRGALSDSSFSYEPFDRRRRILKKSQTIDKRADDMAFRKMHKERAATINDPQSALAKISYLQASPLFGVEHFENHTNSNEPDTTLDDVVYRNFKYANHVPKVVETQPPFGIPLGPITPAANSDYLHAVPNNIYRPSFKPRKIPDIVKDDLAYRNLRKDSSKEAILSPEDVKNNNQFDINSIRKKRAVRSLSANIGSLINKTEHNNEFNDLDNIADAMEIARQVLREKEHKIKSNKKGFLSDNDTNKEYKMNLNNSSKKFDYLNCKPPTPERRSPKTISKLLTRDEDCDSSLDDLLTALATEARETTERINQSLDDKEIIDENLNRQLLAIDAVSHQAKLCEKLLEGVVDVDLMEEVEQIVEEPVIVESIANIVLTRDDSKINNVKIEEVVIESDHDYENLKSDEELNLNVDIDLRMKEKCTSPFEEHKAELIASFQELKKNVELDLPAQDDVTGEACFRVVECDFVDESSINQKLFVTKCDFDVRANQSNSCDHLSNSLNSLERLKSPKLVLELSKNDSDCPKRMLANQSMIRDEPGTSQTRHIFGDDGKDGAAWYRDPANMAVACSYGIACAHQLASLDFVAVLGILFAVLSFIAALIF